MKKNNQIRNGIAVLTAVLCVVAFVSCDTADEPTNEPATEEEVTTMTYHDIITLNKLEETSAVDSTTRIEVRITVDNIQSTAAAEGDKLVLTGYQLCDSTGTTYDWKNEEATTSTEFVSAVTDGSVSYTMFYDASNETTDFKIFAVDTWDDVISDPLEEDNNIKVDFTGFAEAGDVVEMIIDATNL